MVPKTHADVDAVNIFDSRGGNSLLLDDDKLTAISAALIPGEAKPLPEGAKKWTDQAFPLVLGQHRGRLRDAPHQHQDAGPVRAEGPAIRTVPQREICPVLPMNTRRPDHLALPVGQRCAGGVEAGLRLTSRPGKITAQTNKKGETYYTFALEMPPELSGAEFGDRQDAADQGRLQPGGGVEGDLALSKPQRATHGRLRVKTPFLTEDVPMHPTSMRAPLAGALLSLPLPRRRKDQPLWELGVVGGGVSTPAYPGSADRSSRGWCFRLLSTAAKSSDPTNQGSARACSAVTWPNSMWALPRRCRPAPMTSRRAGACPASARWWNSARA